MDNYQIFLQACEFWGEGNGKRAFQLFLKAARNGDSSSQHNVGFFFDEGLGAKRNWKKALYWYRRAWRSGGQSSTCSNIARLYADVGNNRRAKYWWGKAIEMGDGDAALDQAKFLIKRGRKVDGPLVVSLLHFAAKSVHISASGIDEAEELLRHRDYLL